MLYIWGCAESGSVYSGGLGTFGTYTKGAEGGCFRQPRGMQT
jgi:hypothetical protein